ncbi:O-methyltransferase [Brevibacillus ginsengisoli]|uniref:O-methyltransferase n=1 Tax=Brevibacillus ginsengisoli TaxID=363854 RepID=UPI003CF877A4
MDPRVAQVLRELETFGIEFDSQTSNREDRMRNVVPKTGEYLAFLIKWRRPKKVLEIGTSNGYSTIWLAEAARSIGTKVETVELSQSKADMAAENFEKSGLADWINLHQRDAGEYLQEAVSESYPLIFLDSERTEYLGWWADLKRVLERGGIVIADNLLSHASEFGDFLAHVKQEEGFDVLELPLDQGLLLIHKH